MFNQGRIEPPKAARGHATYIDGKMLSVTKYNLVFKFISGFTRAMTQRNCKPLKSLISRLSAFVFNEDLACQLESKISRMQKVFYCCRE